MDKQNENIELRSEEFQEVLSRVPSWILRWGITLVFVILAGLLAGSYFFKYPDIIIAPIVVTTENLPVDVLAKTSGRIDTVFVIEKQAVRKGQMLAYIENSAKPEDVIALKNRLSGFSIGNFHNFEIFSNGFEAGDLQPACNAFQKTAADYDYFLKANYHNKKIAVIEKQISAQKDILQKSKNQLDISQKQLESAKKVFVMDSSLFAKEVISSADFEGAKTLYLQNQQNYENAKLNIDNQQISILQLEQSIFDLQQQRVEQENTLKLSFSTAYDQLSAQIKTWEQTYLLTAHTSGICSFTKYWQKNQNVSAGEILVTVVPTEKTGIIGKIFLPPARAGKVKTGQTVNVKFDDFPYMEYGMVKVQISNIALVPIIENNQRNYVLEVTFPDSLTTTYHKTLTFRQQMQGTSEIITEDTRLLERFLNPVKALFKK